MRISRTLAILLSASLTVAAPLVELTKRQSCAAGSQVCYTFCCLPDTICVYDSTTESGFGCRDPADTAYTPAGIFTYTINPNPTVIVVTVNNGGVTATPTYVQTPGTPGVTPGNTPIYTPGNTPGNTGTLIAPLQPTGTDGTKIPGSTTGSFITAIPTGTGVVPVPVPVNNGGGGGLTAGQIGGIIGGVIGGLGLLGLLLLWCCLYGLCAALGGRKKRHGSDSSVDHERRTWKSYVPLALAGGAAASRRHGHHSSTTIITEKKKESNFGRNAAIVGSLGAFWLYKKFNKEKEPAHTYRPPKYQGAVGGVYHGSDTSYTGTSESSSSTESRSDTTTTSYISHSSSSSGFRSVDSRSPPPARQPPPRRYR